MDKEIEFDKHAKWRIELAKKLYLQIKELTNLTSFFVGGSVSINQADEYSDLEICFVWNTEITYSDRISLYNGLGVKEIILKEVENSHLAFEDTLYYEELQIDIWHLTETYILKTLNDIFVDF